MPAKLTSMCSKVGPHQQDAEDEKRGLASGRSVPQEMVSTEAPEQHTQNQLQPKSKKKTQPNLSFCQNESFIERAGEDTSKVYLKSHFQILSNSRNISKKLGS